MALIVNREKETRQMVLQDIRMSAKEDNRIHLEIFHENLARNYLITLNFHPPDRN
jgi:hypothetical protein